MDYEEYTKTREIRGKEFIFKIHPHDKVCEWIQQQPYLKGTIHHNFEYWAEDHRKAGFPLENPHYWSTVWCDEKICGVYYCTSLVLDVFTDELMGLYDGFLVIDPAFRGWGLAKHLDEFKLFWTYETLNWDYNWTCALPELLDFNIKLGYEEWHQYGDVRDEYTLWRNRPKESFVF